MREGGEGGLLLPLTQELKGLRTPEHHGRMERSDLQTDDNGGRSVEGGGGGGVPSVLRCSGRAGGSSRGCRRQATRRTTASCGAALFGRSEDTAELSADTLCGKRRRRGRSWKHRHAKVC